ncbi:MAG TPA: methyltransferase [Pelagibacterium sp.]|uniref:tRNA1(Val) (adenine(37)-N6)-methyltransferase n=1 Tax=Pelagibacterium sp. TaxID=1967288 RepID=UPI002C044314|nr:methyltransferase [Pelagibacterium sp.]HWJ89245.1 methyltransferase [Pelagibacterium sp.]
MSILQPESGFKAGLDSVLLGASVPEGTKDLLDLGAGAGVAALCALAHDSCRHATLVENNAQMLVLAARNIETNGFAARANLIDLSAAASGTERKARGLATDRFDTVIANPPFFASGTRAPDAARAAARHAEGDIGTWVRTAVSSAHAKGTVIFVHLAEALPQLLDTFGARMGAITVLPIVPRPGRPASRVLVRGTKGSKAPMRLLSPMVLHEETGNGFTPLVQSILRGDSRLDWHNRA